MIQVEKTKMVDAMRSVLPGVDNGSTGIDGANLFLFKDNRLFTYNGVTSVSVPFDMGNAKFGVNAANLFAFVNKLNDLSVNIEPVYDKEDNTKVKAVKVFSGKTKATFNLADTSEIEKYLEGIKFTDGKPCPDNFNDAFNLTTIKNNIHAEMKGVVTTKIGDKMYLAASDKRRISVHELASEMDEFKVDDDVLADAITRVSALAGTTNTNTGLTVQLTFSKEGITAYTEKRDGNAEEFIPWDSDVKFNSDEVVQSWVSINILLEAGSKVTDFKVVMNNPARKSYAFLFTGDKYKALVGGITVKEG